MYSSSTFVLALVAIAERFSPCQLFYASVLVWLERPWASSFSVTLLHCRLALRLWITFPRILSHFRHVTFNFWDPYCSFGMWLSLAQPPITLWHVTLYVQDTSRCDHRYDTSDTIHMPRSSIPYGDWLPNMLRYTIHYSTLRYVSIRQPHVTT